MRMVVQIYLLGFILLTNAMRPNYIQNARQCMERADFAAAMTTINTAFQVGDTCVEAKT